MELKNKEIFVVNFKYKEPPNDSQIEQVKKNEEKIREFCSVSINAYEQAKNYDDFEQRFFMIWYNINARIPLLPVFELLFKHHQIDPPKFFIKEKNLYLSTLQQKRKIRGQNKNYKEDERDEKILEDIIDIGGARFEIYRNKEQDIEEKLKLELKQKEFKEKINEIEKEAKQLVNESTSYLDYLTKLKPLYYKLYDSVDYYHEFDIFEGLIRYGIPYNEKTAWRDKIPKIERELTFVSKEMFPIEKAIEFEKEEEMLEKYENEYYVIRPMIFNDNYAIVERENFILKLLEVSKIYPDLFKFISESIESQVQGFLDRDKRYLKSIEALKDEQIIIYKKMIDVVEKLNISDIEKQNAFKKLLPTNLKKSLYYTDYQNIKAEIDRNIYDSNERDRANELGIDSFTGWKYAFYVLAFRNEGNIHFKSSIKDESGNRFEFTKNSLDSCFSIFHNAYNTYIHRQTNK